MFNITWRHEASCTLQAPPLFRLSRVADKEKSPDRRFPRICACSFSSKSLKCNNPCHCPGWPDVWNIPSCEVGCGWGLWSIAIIFVFTSGYSAKLSACESWVPQSLKSPFPEWPNLQSTNCVWYCRAHPVETPAVNPALVKRNVQRLVIEIPLPPPLPLSPAPLGKN